MSLSSSPTPTRILASATADDFAASSSGFCPRESRQAPFASAVRRVGDRARLARRLCGIRRDAQAFGQILKSLRAFLSARFDRGQHLSGRVDGLQNEGYQRWIELPLAIAQLAQQALGLMGDLLQRRKREETARALDGVNGAENARQQRRVLRVLLQFNEFLIQAREILMTLHQKFTNHFLILHALVLHGARRFRRRPLWHVTLASPIKSILEGRLAGH